MISKIFPAILFFILTAFAVNAQDSLSAKFELQKGKLDYPLAQPDHEDYSKWRDGPNTNIMTFIRDKTESVHVIFEGTVLLVQEVVAGIDAVTVRSGKYYITYANISNVKVRKDDYLHTGQIIADMGLNYDGKYQLELYMENGFDEIDPKLWLRKL